MGSFQVKITDFKEDFDKNHRFLKNCKIFDNEVAFAPTVSLKTYGFLTSFSPVWRSLRAGFFNLKKLIQIKDFQYNGWF